MKITAQASFWVALVLVVFCAGYAFTGLSSIDATTTEAQREASHGFAYFWLFLGAVFAIIAVISRMMAKGRFGQLD